jgi:hypothetical protein
LILHFCIFFSVKVGVLNVQRCKNNKISKFIKKIKPGIDDICVLAGDIGNPYSSNYDIFMNFINENFKKLLL